MKPLVRRVLLLLILGLAPLTASAKDLRFPEKGFPAYAIVLPDDWGLRTDVEDNLIMISPNRVSSLVVLVGVSTGDALDEIAKVALETAKSEPFTRKEPAEISGFKGFTYFSILKSDEGAVIRVEVTIVRVDANHIASASLLLFPTVTKADESTARMVKNGFKLVTE